MTIIKGLYYPNKIGGNGKSGNQREKVEGEGVFLYLKNYITENKINSKTIRFKVVLINEKVCCVASRKSFLILS